MAEMKYIDELIAIKGIGIKLANKIVRKYPTKEDLGKAEMGDLVELLPDNMIGVVMTIGVAIAEEPEPQPEAKIISEDEPDVKDKEKPEKDPTPEAEVPEKETKKVETEYTIGRGIAVKIDGRDMDGVILEELKDKVEASIHQLGGMARILKKSEIQLRPRMRHKGF